jgi:hypothetical protein
MRSRINARLDDKLASSLAETMRQTGKTLTEVVTEALEIYCASASVGRQGPLAILEASGFVGSGRGPRDLSRSYKKHLTASLRRKA